jgi:alcohol dehydrogenase class IV
MRDFDTLASSVVAMVETLMKDIRMPLHIRELDIPREAIPSMEEKARTVQRVLVNNPRPMELKYILQTYEQAY